MTVFEGRAWISKQQALVDVSIEVDNGLISSVKKNSLERKKEKVQGIILPSALDMHVHFRDPGYPHKEDWKTGSESAACGGVTAVVDMPNTNPFTSDINSNRTIIINPSNDDIIMDEQVAQASKIALVHLEEVIGSTIYKEKYRIDKKKAYNDGLDPIT